MAYKTAVRVTRVFPVTVEGELCGTGQGQQVFKDDPLNGYGVEVIARIVGMKGQKYTLFVRPQWRYEDGDYLLYEDPPGIYHCEQALWEQLNDDFGHRLDAAEMDDFIHKIMKAGLDAAREKLETRIGKGRTGIFDI
jgi:hypothetical protein